jgi:hypothetical protein
MAFSNYISTQFTGGIPLFSKMQPPHVWCSHLATIFCLHTPWPLATRASSHITWRKLSQHDMSNGTPSNRLSARSRHQRVFRRYPLAVHVPCAVHGRSQGQKASRRQHIGAALRNNSRSAFPCVQRAHKTFVREEWLIILVQGAVEAYNSYCRVLSFTPLLLQNTEIRCSGVNVFKNVIYTMHAPLSAFCSLESCQPISKSQLSLCMIWRHTCMPCIQITLSAFIHQTIT